MLPVGNLSGLDSLCGDCQPGNFVTDLSSRNLPLVYNFWDWFDQRREELRLA